MLDVRDSTTYYPIRGTTAEVMFDEIDKNRLFDTKARPAIGLTSAKWNMEWKGIEARPHFCGAVSMSIGLALVVTLPRHDRPGILSPEVRANWERFAERVAAHERRHVDIYLAGLKTMKARMEELQTKSYSCAELENAIRRTWDGQQAETERAQDAFHVEDEAKIQNDRRPLQARVDLNQTRLAALDAEIKGLDRTLDDLKRQRDGTRAGIDAVTSEMARSGASPASCSQSRASYRMQALCQRYNALEAADNSLVDQYNGVVSRRNNLVHEHNDVLALTNGLIETLNWTR